MVDVTEILKEIERRVAELGTNDWCPARAELLSLKVWIEERLDKNLEGLAAACQKPRKENA